MKKYLLQIIFIQLFFLSYSQDTIPPTLINFSITPQIIDVTNASKNVTISFTITDNFSGTSGCSPIITFPDLEGFSAGANLISGTTLNGIWSITLPITSSEAAGIATVGIFVSDIVGNLKTYTFEDITSLGFDADFEIINSNSIDTTPPILTDLNISPQIIDVSDTSQFVEISFSLTDAQSGVSSGGPQVYFPNSFGYGTSGTLITGTSNNGTWKLEFPVPFALQPGISTISLNVFDIAGNYKQYSYEELKTLGFDPDFEIVNNKDYDTIPPTLVGLVIGPQIVDVSDTTKFVQLTFELNDNLAGIAGATPTIYYPNSTQLSTGASFVSGTPNVGIYSLKQPIPHGMSEGLAKFDLTVYDKTGNNRTYSYEDMLNSGFDPDFEIVFSTYRINGNTYFDRDFNGCTSDDLLIPSLKFNITNNEYINYYLSSSSGVHFIPVIEGENKITPLILHPEKFDVNPSIFNITIPTTQDTIIQNFCVTPVGNLRDMEISILPLTPPARPGFDAQYKVVITNKGNQIENGTLYFAYDEARLDFVSTDVNPSTQIDGLLSWNFTDLLPFETRYYNVTLNVNSPSETPPVNAGDELLITCNILDNVFLLKQTVVGSYDPNDKTCLEGKTITPEQLGEYVHYLIRFENTGNYAAENIVVKDVIDASTFDISTLQIVDASHEAWARINGNVVEFIFENIQLPFDDATNDGYISFKIKTKERLELGHELKNEANIYFDYNLPILTNMTNTVVAIPVGTDETVRESDIEIFPNPVSDVLRFASKDKILKVEIFDMSGRLVQVSSVVDGEVVVEGLMRGNYQMKLYSHESRRNARMVKI